MSHDKEQAELTSKLVKSRGAFHGPSSEGSGDPSSCWLLAVVLQAHVFLHNFLSCPQSQPPVIEKRAEGVRSARSQAVMNLKEGDKVENQVTKFDQDTDTHGFED